MWEFKLKWLKYVKYALWYLYISISSQYLAILIIQFFQLLLKFLIIFRSSSATKVDRPFTPYSVRIAKSLYLLHDELILYVEKCNSNSIKEKVLKVSYFFWMNVLHILFCAKIMNRSLIRIAYDYSQ